MKQLMMTLALLLTAATGAWAESKPIGLNVEYAAGDVITTTSDVYVYHDEGQVIKITSTTPASIRRIAGIEVSFNEGSEYEVIYQNPDDDPGGTIIVQFIKCVGESTGDATVVHVASGTGTKADPYVFAPGSFGNAFPISWSATTPNTATIIMAPSISEPPSPMNIFDFFPNRLCRENGSSAPARMIMHPAGNAASDA